MQNRNINQTQEIVDASRLAMINIDKKTIFDYETVITIKRKKIDMENDRLKTIVSSFFVDRNSLGYKIVFKGSSLDEESDRFPCTDAIDNSQ